MTKLISIIILCLTLTACSQETTFDKEIWLESDSMTIYESSKTKLFTGTIEGQEEGNVFYGNVINGKPEGICFWLNPNSDTIQILRFQDGEKIFSQQFDQNGNKRGNQWSMQSIETKNSDKELIADVLKLLLNNSIDSLRSFYQPSSSIPELDLISNKIRKIKEDKGEVKDYQVLNIKKRKYTHIDEFHTEAEILLYTEKGDLNYNIRLLTKNRIITSINFWKQENEFAKNDFIKPDFYFFLKM